MKSKNLTRCIIFVMAIFMVAMITPGFAQAQILLHGAGVQKVCSCVNAGDPIDCTIAATYNDDFGDTIKVVSAADIVSASGGDVTDSNLRLASTDVSGNAVCCAGPVLPCFIGPGGSTATIPNVVSGCGDLSLPGTGTPGKVFFKDTAYTTVLADAGSLPDSATIQVADLCNAPGTSGCNVAQTGVSFSATSLVCGSANECAPSTCTENTPSGTCQTIPVTCDDQCQTCDTADGVCKTTVTCDDKCQTCDSADGVCKTTVTCSDKCQTCDSADGVCKTTVTCSDKCQTCDSADGVCKTTVTCEPNLPDSCCDSATGECTPNLAGHPECATAAAICRTPGFWGTHGCPCTNGGCEKTKGVGSQNITQDVINACDPISVCGQAITNTCLGSPSSAVEAICVSPRGDISLQLIRQLTSMALNCCISGFKPDCSGDTNLGNLFGECNGICQGGTDNTLTVQSCVEQIDCFNNGGVFTDDFCQTGTCANGDPCNGETACADLSTCTPLPNNCHDRALCQTTTVDSTLIPGELCFDANAAGVSCADAPSGAICTGQPGAAGSSKECNNAIKN